MITCDNCGTVYDDDANYCNTCGCSLEGENSHYLADQKKMQLRAREQINRKQKLIYLLAGISILFPFYAASDLFPLAIQGLQRVLWTLLILAISAISILGIKKAKRWTQYTILALCALLLPLFPIGTLLAATLFYFWIFRKPQ